MIDDAQASRKAVALVIFAKLLAGNREWRARETASHQINALVAPGIKFIEVFLMHRPLRPVETQRVAGIGIDLDNARMLEARALQANRLTARARTQL